MVTRRTPREALPKLAAYTVAAFAVVAPQFLGGATPETELTILSLGVAVSIMASLAVSRVRRDLGAIPLACIGAGIAAVWTLMQLIPLPCQWIAVVFPERMEVMQELVKLRALDAPRCSVSGAPGSTRAALALATTLFAILLASVGLSRAGQRRILLHGVALSSVLMAIVAVVHVVVDADSVFGVYTPRSVRPGLLLAPLLNANHLAGHLALGFPLCLAFGLTHDRLDVRMGWLAAGFLVLVCGMFTLSRGGAGALVLGGGGYLVFHLLRKRKEELSRKTLVGAAAALITAGVAAFVGIGITAEVFRVEGASLDKLALPAQLLELARRHPVLGVGRGALGDASPEIFTGTAWVLYAENFLAQWSIEWGVVATAVIVGLFAASFVRVRPRRRQDVALCFGLLALVAQNLVDYSLEIAGVASVATLAFGLLISKESTLSAMRSLRLKAVLPGGVVAAAAATLFSAPVLTRDARPNIRGQLEALLATSGQTFDLRLSQALLQYPVDPALLVYGSAHAIRSGRRSAPAWLNLSMRVAPRWFGPHAQAAYYFEQLGRLDQAAVELSLAGEIDFYQWWLPACEFIQRHPRAEIALATTALGNFRELSLERALACCAPFPREAAQLAELILAELPSFVHAHLVLANAAAESGDEPLARSRIQQALHVRTADPKTWETYLRVLHRLGHSQEALERYQQVPASARTSPGVLWAAADIAAATRDVRVLDAVLSELVSRYGTSVASRAQLEAQASRLYAQAGESLQALASAQSAFEALGTPELAELTHSAALRANLPGVALRMASELCHVAHRNRWYCSNPTLPPP